MVRSLRDDFMCKGCPRPDAYRKLVGTSGQMEDEKTEKKEINSDKEQFHYHLTSGVHVSNDAVGLEETLVDHRERSLSLLIVCNTLHKPFEPWTVLRNGTQQLQALVHHQPEWLNGCFAFNLFS